MKYTFLLLFGSLLFSNLHAQSTSEFVKKGYDAIFDKNEKLALSYFKEGINLNQKDDDAYAGASLMYSRLGNRQATLAAKKKYFLAAKTHAAVAIKLAPNKSVNNYAMAAAMGRMALISGSKEKVAASRDIKKYAMRAIQYDKNNAQAWNVLGKWHFAVSNLNFAEKAAANMLFGGLPDGDIASAIENFEQSMKVDPTYVMNYLDLGKSYLQVGKKSEAKTIFQKGVRLTAVYEDDAAFKKEMQELLNGL